MLCLPKGGGDCCVYLRVEEIVVSTGGWRRLLCLPEGGGDCCAYLRVEEIVVPT